MIINGIDISRRYTLDEIFEMNGKGLLKPISLQGYVVRADAEGMIGFVPWHQSTLARQEAGKPVTQNWDADLAKMREDVERENPMVRTSPHAKVARMITRLLGDAQRTGTIAGLSDEQIRTITGEYWKTGETQVTEAMVRKVAAHFMQNAERQNRAADAKRVTRAHPLA